MKRILFLTFMLLIVVILTGCQKKEKILKETVYELYEGETKPLKLEETFLRKKYVLSQSEAYTSDGLYLTGVKQGEYEGTIIIGKKYDKFKVIIKEFDYGFKDSETYSLYELIDPKFNLPPFKTDELKLEETEGNVLLSFGTNRLYAVREGKTKLKLTHVGKTFYKDITVSGINELLFTFHKIPLVKEFSTVSDPLVIEENGKTFKVVNGRVVEGIDIFHNIQLNENGKIISKESEYFENIDYFTFLLAPAASGVLTVTVYEKDKGILKTENITIYSDDLVAKKVDIKCGGKTIRFEISWKPDLESSLKVIEVSPFRLYQK